ncbi:hypothetical protein ACFVVL_26670 [Kitasatospora sp. NPDC058115]
MATTAWNSARSGTLRLFHRSGPEEQRALEVQLDREAAVVSQDEDPESARLDFAGGWRRQLAALLREHPEAEVELRALVESVQAQLPAAENTRWTQNISATGHGMAIGAQGGNVHFHQAPPVPGTASAQRDDDA